MIDLSMDEISRLEVDVQVNGTEGKRFNPHVRMSLINEGMRISFNAEQAENGKFAVEIPPLRGLLKAGRYNVELEVFVDGKHFVPTKGVASLKEEIKPVAKITQKQSDQIVLSAELREVEKPIEQVVNNHQKKLIKKGIITRQI